MRCCAKPELFFLRFPQVSPSSPSGCLFSSPSLASKDPPLPPMSPMRSHTAVSSPKSLKLLVFGLSIFPPKCEYGLAVSPTAFSFFLVVHPVPFRHVPCLHSPRKIRPAQHPVCLFNFTAYSQSPSPQLRRLSSLSFSPISKFFFFLPSPPPLFSSL